MKFYAVLPAAVFLLFLPFLFSCEQQETPVSDSGRVEATQAYVHNFGEPPQGKKGRAFARVAYLPLRDDPQKLRAFPVYLFSEG
ncbi:MAG: hypothetical protein GWO30_10415, partial [Gammaproteobacteria bacterium]|nr:hypothetical protein [Gammaproteobacteria bacterium]NIV71145.1 hypothetical protein [Phycisphaerae bacterium]NIY20820.1 hypothetical protein [Gammaproteobacteria bacterium]